MQIDFYEEFPTKENLEKLRLIKYPIGLFVAAKSVEEFKKLEKQIKKIKKDVEVAYWPIVPNSYWISPFSNTRDLIKIFKKLNRIRNLLLIDLEPPFKNKKLFLKNMLNFSRNKKIIGKFMKENKNRITTAEFPSSAFSLFYRIFGLNYDVKTERSLMWYSSMMPKSINKHIRNNLSKLKNKSQYSISLGTIDIGILGSEPILPPKNLEEDLEFVKKAGFKKVIIFRLGGLNKKYIEVINKFQKMSSQNTKSYKLNRKKYN